MENNDLISVVVPVYNVEKYLDNCINSILNQTYKNIEIILVDDGSIDNSGIICDKYKSKNVKVIHQKNKGPSEARNIGIKFTNGEYVLFIDSDDDIDEDYVEYLHLLIKKYNVKMSICQLGIINDNKIVDSSDDYEECLMDTKMALERMLCEEGYNVSPCGKMYHKSILKDFKYPKNKICEDNASTYKLIMKCNSIAFGNKAKYNYYKRDNSIMNSSFTNKKLDLIELTDIMAKDILKKYPDLSNSVSKRIMNSRFSILRQMVNSKLDKNLIKTKKEIIKYIKKNKIVILKNPKSSKKDKLALISLLLGERFFKLSWNIYSNYLKWR